MSRSGRNKWQLVPFYTSPRFSCGTLNFQPIGLTGDQGDLDFKFLDLTCRSVLLHVYKHEIVSRQNELVQLAQIEYLSYLIIKPFQVLTSDQFGYRIRQASLWRIS